MIIVITINIVTKTISKVLIIQVLTKVILFCPCVAKKPTKIPKITIVLVIFTV